MRSDPERYLIAFLLSWKVHHNCRVGTCTYVTVHVSFFSPVTWCVFPCNEFQYCSFQNASDHLTVKS